MAELFVCELGQSYPSLDCSFFLCQLVRGGLCPILSPLSILLVDPFPQLCSSRCARDVHQWCTQPQGVLILQSELLGPQK